MESSGCDFDQSLTREYQVVKHSLLMSKCLKFLRILKCVIVAFCLWSLNLPSLADDHMSHAEFVKLMRESRMRDIEQLAQYFARKERTKAKVQDVTESTEQQIWIPVIDTDLVNRGQGCAYTYRKQPPPPSALYLETLGDWHSAISDYGRALMESPLDDARRENLVNALIRYSKHQEK